MRLLLPAIFIVLPLLAGAQVEHNFDMEPSNTNCHELPEVFDSANKAIATLTATKFRSEQSLKISRYQSPRSAIYYSCDGKTGYLVVNIDDNIRYVYQNIPQHAWDGFMNSTDPIRYYSKEIKPNYKNIE